MNYKELICLQRKKELVLTTKKKSVVWMEETLKSLLGEKYLLGKTCPLLRQEYSE